MSLRYLDICSGISAPTMAWEPLGWQALCFAEIEAAPRAVLAHHYPDVPLRGDFTEIKGTEYGPVDLLVGGTPCQSFSVAGLRGGLGDGRGNLALEYLRLADRARPRWLAWENVPGVLSSNGGRDFGAIVGGMVELGYGIAYRVLDAQYIGVPQRRRRVFVVGYLGDWRRAAAVLFERHSLQGHSPPSREKGERVAGTLKACAGKSGTPNGAEEADRLIAHSLRAEGFDASEDGTGRGTPLVPVVFQSKASASNSMNPGQVSPAIDVGKSDGLTICFSAKDHGADASDIAPTLRAGGHSGSHANAGVMPAVAFQEAQTGCREYPEAGTLRAGGPGHDPVGTRLRIGSAVRRLTPRECERLQGFPDDFTLVPHRGKPMADGPRYKMLGNSMAVPVVRWIGERIAAVEAITRDSRHLPNGEDRSCGLRAEPKWRGDAKRQSPLTHCKGSLFDTEGMAA